MPTWGPCASLTVIAELTRAHTRPFAIGMRREANARRDASIPTHTLTYAHPQAVPHPHTFVPDLSTVLLDSIQTYCHRINKDSSSK